MMNLKKKVINTLNYSIEEESILQRMEDYISKKKESSMSSYNIKKAFKGIVGAEMDDVTDRQKMIQDFVKNLTPEERKQMKEEIREAKYKEYLKRKGVTASHEIAAK